MIIYPNCSKKVIGGIYNNIEPVERNIKLIEYLERTGIKFLCKIFEKKFKNKFVFRKYYSF